MQRLALVLQLVGGGITLSALIVAFRASSRQTAGRVEAVTAAVAARRQVEHLFAMTDILQSATGYADANAVLVSTARRLLPDFGGSLYIFNNSRDRLDLSVAWSSNAAERVDDAPATISSDACWAMKRGKPHINEAGGHALRCEHAATEKVFLEIPMLARGEVYGLLQFIPADGVAPSLTDVTPLAIALADGMSLALSSIALREKLRNQALRDPLTGLHNRRFMEEVLGTLCPPGRAARLAGRRDHDRSRPFQAPQRPAWPRDWRRRLARRGGDAARLTAPDGCRLPLWRGRTARAVARRGSRRDDGQG